jgi:zinc transport system permease protein
MSFFDAIGAYGYMQRALAAGVIVGLVCAVLSVYVVLKRMAFIGQGISHAAFGGVALGLLLFQSATRPDRWISLITAAFCLAVAFAIGITTRRGPISADSAIGIFFAASMALGVLFVALRKRYTAEVFAYLFGSVLSVTQDDVVAIAILAGVVLLAVAAFYKELLFYSFDERMAGVSGLPVGALHYLLLALLALTIVVAVKVVGIVLMSAFLVIPGATARLVTGEFRRMMGLSVVIGVGSAVAGLALSNAWDVPPGATIVLIQFAVFAAGAGLRPRRALG